MPPVAPTDRPPRLRAALVWGIALLTGSVRVAAASATAPEPFVWDNVERIVTVGDVHGTYEPLVFLLQSAKLIDEEWTWVGGADHLVVVGDFLDRNAGDRPIMDLLRRLQDESRLAGGRVHVLIGNHEVMNLVRDYRYVAPGSYADFVEDETERDRKRGRRLFLSQRPPGVSLAELREQFDKLYPPGYFGRQRAFDPDGEYGSWILELPIAIKVNDVVFVHGGFTEEVAGLGLGGVNRRVRELLQYHLEQRETLERHGVVTPLMSFPQLQDAAVRVLRRERGRGWPDAVRNAADSLLRLANAPLFGENGPLWYRGHAVEDERIERDRLERVLEMLGARAMVVAHSPTPGSRITSRFSNRLYRVDYGLSEGNSPLALVFSGDKVRVFDPYTQAFSDPQGELPHGEGWWITLPAALPDAQMERFLRNAPIVEARELGRGGTRPKLLVLADGNSRRRALFKTVELAAGVGDGKFEGMDRYQHEVAAYLLDRKLGLGLVPVTVQRRFDGTRGSLQAWVEAAVDLGKLRELGLVTSDPAAIERQLAAGRVFDALIGNPDRQSSDVLVLPRRGEIRLIDHSRAFQLSTDVTTAETAVAQGELAEALCSLDREWLDDALGSLLSRQQIDALLDRRDRMVAEQR